ncbi:MAG TPA: class II glutamine amidotransferase [Acidimicrobiia bacterium]
MTRSDQPAFADRTYLEVAGAIDSRAIIAHIRTATVGPVAIENTHPFSHGPWVFAHNGTIGGFEHVRTRLDLGLYAPPWGDTDSETVFRWILNRMGDYGLDPEAPAESVEPVVGLIEDSVSELIDLAIAVEAPTPPGLNFVIGDGRNLVASRFGNGLFWTFRRSLNDCSICGTSHCEQADETYKAVVVASEPLSGEEWLELPEGTVFGVDARLETMSRSLISGQTAPVGRPGA